MLTVITGDTTRIIFPSIPPPPTSPNQNTTRVVNQSLAITGRVQINGMQRGYGGWTRTAVKGDGTLVGNDRARVHGCEGLVRFSPAVTVALAETDI